MQLGIESQARLISANRILTYIEVYIPNLSICSTELEVTEYNSLDSLVWSRGGGD